MADQLPGRGGVEHQVDLVGESHDLAHRLGKLARLKQFAHLRDQSVRVGLRLRWGCDQFASVQEFHRPRCDVDVLSHQVAVDAGHEVVGYELDILVARAELGGDVVAQPLRVHPKAQVFQRVQPGAAALAHLLGIDGQETVHMHGVGRLAAAEMQQGRPEQCVKSDDVLTDEVVLLQRRVGHEGLVVDADAVQVVLQRSQVANRCVEPDVKILAGCARNLDAEVGRVAADVPVAEFATSGLVGRQPLFDLVVDLGLQPRLAASVCSLAPLL